MLTNAYNSGKLVAITGAGSVASQVLYTVPEGKTFIGHVTWGAGSGVNVTLSLNGVDVVFGYGSTTTQGGGSVPITLPAGTVVSTSATGTAASNLPICLIGNEVQ
ncbi:hypothetical protein CPT_Seuss37 [Caulobacter phage Seuss]|uniref:Uncharacterized protein n=1 Tax=Caulobacter phage Seuss TaxID=1675601 RepID=A0A0K1LMY4_9CAUD|nr:hypothetical protein HOR08_gp037 [Caulobacter phage Seuss]AKU43563.1 hypothetical protein CPT_Seuss37 [Caulobacter phage Seuss]